MGEFWTYQSTGQIDFLFGKNHYLILLTSLVLIIFFSMYTSRQKLKFQKIFVFICSLFLIGCEVGRVFWRSRYLASNGLPINFISVFELNFYMIALWISIPLLLLSIIIKKDNKKSVFGLTFFFSITTLLAVGTLIYPVGINTNFQLYHFYNLSYILSRTTVITLGLIFVLGKWISTGEFSDMWRCFISLCLFGIICGVLAFCLAGETNLLYFKEIPIFSELGIPIPFPWSYLLLGLFVFVLQNFIYLPFRLHHARRMKKFGTD